MLQSLLGAPEDNPGVGDTDTPCFEKAGVS